MKRLKIDWKDVVELICKTYHIKNLKLMQRYGYEADGPIPTDPEYVEGELE